VENCTRSFFSALVRVLEKNESVQCAAAKNFLWVAFSENLFSALALEAVSVVVGVFENVRSGHKSLKFAGC
jgi:hypothetical protein